MSYERTGQEEARLQAEIAALPTKAGVVDAGEDERWGEAFRGDELPEELQRREKRLAAIQAANVRLEAAQRARDDDRGREPGQDRHPRGGRAYMRAYGEPEPKAQRNFTDPQSQIMKTSSKGFQQCYNAQMAVDGEHQIIVATQVEPQVNDQSQLVGLLDGNNETFGVEPAVVLTDAGYCNELDRLELETCKRRNCCSGSQPIHSSRGRSLNAPACQPMSASQRSPSTATCRTLRPTKVRKGR